MAGIAKGAIVKASLKGVKNAFSKYGSWSGGAWLERAPEGFLQFEVAEALKEADCAYITLEDSVKDIMRWASCNNIGKPPKVLKGRIDIIVWNKAPRPLTLVEVKKAQGNKSLNSDAQRIRTILGKCPGIRFGIAVAYSYAKSKNVLENRFKQIAEEINGKLEDWDVENKDGSFWGGAVFSLKAN